MADVGPGPPTLSVRVGTGKTGEHSGCSWRSECSGTVGPSHTIPVVAQVPEWGWGPLPILLYLPT